LTQVIGLFIGGLPDGPRRWVLSWLPAGSKGGAGPWRGRRRTPASREESGPRRANATESDALTDR